LSRSGSFDLEPIGAVRSPVKESVKREWRDVVSELVIYSHYAPALGHIEEFSHVIVVYWMHHVSPLQRSVLTVHPMNDDELPLVGVFAARSPSRPNPLGIMTAELIERRANVLVVRGLDAIDGTPVLDIKPFLGGYDAPAGARVPVWLVKAWERQK